MNFKEIAARTGTDKAAHGYGPWYDAHFSGLREEALTFLEIGIGWGNSLRLWEEYFPRACIFAIDGTPSCLKYQSDRSRVFIGDQADSVFLSKTVSSSGPLNIVVDDGGHHMAAQQVSFRTLFPHVKPGGWYVIEDLSTCYDKNWGGGPVGTEGTTIEMLKSLVADLHLWSHHEAPLAPARISEIHFYPSIVFIRRQPS